MLLALAARSTHQHTLPRSDAAQQDKRDQQQPFVGVQAPSSWVSAAAFHVSAGVDHSQGKPDLVKAISSVA